MQINTLFSLFYCQFKYELQDQEAILQHHWNKLDIATQDFIFITQSYKVKGNKTLFVLTAHVKFVLMVEPLLHTNPHNKYLNTSLQPCTRKTN